MKRRYLTTALVGIIFVVMVVWVMRNERGRVSETGEVFALQLTDLQTIDMQAADYKFTAERRGDDWWITSPFVGMADADKMKPLLEAVAGLKPVAREGQNLSDPLYGLQSPVLTLTVTYGRHQTATIRLGAESPLGQKSFASISGKSALFLIDQSFKPSVDLNPQELRDKKVTKLTVDTATGLTIARADGSVTIGQVPLAGEPAWQITAPRKLPADGSTVEGVLRSLGDSETLDYLPYTAANLTATGLDAPRLTVHCLAKDAPAVTVWLGKTELRTVTPPPAAPGAKPSVPAPQLVVYVARSGRQEILVLPASYFVALDKSLLDLRDKHLLVLKAPQVNGLKVEAEKGLAFRASKSGQQWQLLAPKTGNGNYIKLDDIVTNLLGLQAVSYEVEGKAPADLSKYGLTAPQVVVTVGVEGGAPIVLSIGSAVPNQPGRVYARTSLANDVYVIDDSLLRALPKSVDELLAPAGMPPPGASGMPGGQPGMPPGMPPGGPGPGDMPPPPGGPQ